MLYALIFVAQFLLITLVLSKMMMMNSFLKVLALFYLVLFSLFGFNTLERRGWIEVGEQRISHTQQMFNFERKNGEYK